MGDQVRTPTPLATRDAAVLIPVLDLAAKVVVLVLIALVVLDPGWGHLEGKAPTARGLTYPLVAFVVPAYWYLRPGRTRYPWLADLLVTGTAFSDVLGNRLDLFDQIVWFDDWMHVMNTALVGAAAVLLTMDRSAGFWAVLERAVAVGLTISLAWEVFEYFSFVTNSPELTWAYSDTLGDLALGWLGTAIAAVCVHTAWRSERTGTAATGSVRAPRRSAPRAGRSPRRTPRPSAR
jgi:hypothetical protein